jgi:hypothetical protein
MKLETAEHRADCKLWVTHRELDVMRRVVLTGGALILPEHVVAHLKAHGHESTVTFPTPTPMQPAQLWQGLAMHLLPWTSEDYETR